MERTKNSEAFGAQHSDQQPNEAAAAENLGPALPNESVRGALVLSYLIERGYERSARALCSSVRCCDAPKVDLVKNVGYKSLADRRRWTASILEDGDIHKTVLEAGMWLAEHTSHAVCFSGEQMGFPVTFPAVWEPFVAIKSLHPWFAFRACLQQYVEYLRDGKAAQAISYARHYLRVALWEQLLPTETEPDAGSWIELLEDHLVLLAFTNPEKSPLGKLMATERRKDIADELNALVVACERNQTGLGSALERMLRHVWAMSALHEEMRTSDANVFWQEIEAKSFSEYMRQPDPAL
ncbi:hypothetical protein, conserved [Cyanidioschyzon merolae strain 10D]|jgi:hypothetical protein|uniref:CRA domain-containing protein n=1 Tax=Cyanidioschyzon merolae (strain NIES-3377 / 10D) TaxID=280699 RepID=M1VLS5_CYAM1|nr:hypothetical protein, conserved [Cyanidioschyzon merolae strain 10D]BAM82728.1 hypothetical protein, conserved [Cyanidioschyzon merolae strain 10D]|eukprot:XP_005538764.1 hypothetical protein, conserved [Cyanidioschyzon merolae strain 10D]